MFSSLNKTRDSFLKLILLAISAGTALISAELFLQFQDYKSHLVSFEESKTDPFQISPFLQIEPRESLKDKINKDFFRGESVDLSDNTFRIFALGGSTTFSLKLPYEQTYPKKLEDKLRKFYPDAQIQIQNAACDWYSTQHSIIRFLFRIRHYKPDVIIVMHGINDLLRSFAPEEYIRSGDSFQPDYSHYLGALADLGRDSEPYFPFQHLLLLEKARDARRLLKIKQTPKTRAPVNDHAADAKAVNYFKSLKIFEENLKNLVKIARMLDTKIILLTQPSLYRTGLTPEEIKTLYFASWHMREDGQHPDLSSLEKGMKLYNEAVRRAAEEMKVPLVDLEPQVPKTGAYFFDDVHPKEPATEIEAKIIFEKLTELGWIELWKKNRTAS